MLSKCFIYQSVPIWDNYFPLLANWIQSKSFICQGVPIWKNYFHWLVKKAKVWTPLSVWTLAFLPYILFCNPAHKTEIGTTNRWELLIANHLDQSFTIDQSKMGSSSQIIFITLFSSRCRDLLLSKYTGEKPFSWAKLAYVDFVLSWRMLISLCRGVCWVLFVQL